VFKKERDGTDGCLCKRYSHPVVERVQWATGKGETLTAIMWVPVQFVVVSNLQSPGPILYLCPASLMQALAGKDALEKLHVVLAVSEEQEEEVVEELHERNCYGWVDDVDYY
jgi:hypothetical protein